MEMLAVLSLVYLATIPLAVIRYRRFAVTHAAGPD